jgi:hypothetical protein
MSYIIRDIKTKQTIGVYREAAHALNAVRNLAYWENRTGLEIVLVGGE